MSPRRVDIGSRAARSGCGFGDFHLGRLKYLSRDIPRVAHHSRRCILPQIATPTVIGQTFPRNIPGEIFEALIPPQKRFRRVERDGELSTTFFVRFFFA